MGVRSGRTLQEVLERAASGRTPMPFGIAIKVAMEVAGDRLVSARSIVLSDAGEVDTSSAEMAPDPQSATASIGSVLQEIVAGRANTPPTLVEVARAAVAREFSDASQMRLALAMVLSTTGSRPSTAEIAAYVRSLFPSAGAATEMEAGSPPRSTLERALASEAGLQTDDLDDMQPGADPLLGKVLGERYRILRRIGGGGMGSVYEAQHTLIGRRVALKLLHAQFAADAAVVKRFLNEARAAGMLGHPNILESTDMGRAPDGSPFLVLELLLGKDLQEEMTTAGPFPTGRAVRIAMQIASGLGAAHAKGIVHRDLKPHNIFLTDRPAPDHVKVLDFGISKFGGGMLTGAGTHSGAVLGTPHYMAPEQITDASRADARADVYALGVVLFHMLTGRVPFDAESFPKLVTRVLSEPPPQLSALRPDLPPEIVAAIERCLEKAPEDRWQTMEALGAALAPFEKLDTAPVVAAPTSPPRPSADATLEETLQRAPAAPRKRTPLVAAALVVIVGVVAGGLYIAAAGPTEPPSEEEVGSIAETTAPALVVAAPPPRSTAPPEPAVDETALPATAAQEIGRRSRRIARGTEAQASPATAAPQTAAAAPATSAPRTSTPGVYTGPRGDIPDELR